MSKKIEFAVKGLIVQDGKFLALHKTKQQSPRYELPGGRMEFGEQAEMTLLREMKEETNLLVEPIVLLDTWNYVTTDYQITGVIYLCQIKEGELKLSDEHDHYVWLDLSEDSLNQMVSIFRERMKHWNFERILSLNNDKNVFILK